MPGSARAYDRVLALLQQLYAAPGSHEGWERFLLHLCSTLHGSSAKFIDHSLDGHAAIGANISVVVHTDPQAVDDYTRLWYQHDPWRNAMSREIVPGTVLVGDALVAPERLRRTPFCQEFGRHYDSTQLLAGILEISPRRISNISVNRSDADRRFESADAELLGALMPHLDGAIGLHRRLCGAELMAGHMAAVLDQLPHAVILVSGNGRRVATNREADRILQNRDGLVHERGELRAATQAATDRLRTALQAAVRTGAGEGLDAPTPLALPRPSGRRPLAVMVAPLPAQRVAFNDDGAAAAVFVTDPEHGRTPDYKAIAALFGLTPAESRLVTCLVTGQNLEEAATSLQVKLESVRTRLKTVFEKTGTHRQAELVRLVMNSGPGLGPGAR